LFILPFIICFFLTFLLVAYGLWRIKTTPRWAPLMLAIGSVLFPMAQAQAEPNIVLYVAATTAWLLGVTLVYGRARWSAGLSAQASAGGTRPSAPFALLPMGK
jgi:hypothetical protein